MDCGSTAVDTISWLKQHDLDVIVLDHHQITDPPPPAYAMVNPQVTGGPFCELSSAGLAFKLVHAVVKACREMNQPPSARDYDLRPLLDLVALGTIADLVPLVDENRILVTAGLKRLNQTKRPGLLALMEIAQVRDELGVFEISFQLGPRINAAGRLVNADTALRLMLSDDLEEARQLARELDAHNRQRQMIERDIADQAVDSIRSEFDPKKDFVIVQGNGDWHVGVVGIVASRVLREFYRPTIILGGEGSEWRGSGRSVEGFDLAEALRSCDDLLKRHGGHAMAAGMSIQPENLTAFRKRINAFANQRMKGSCPPPVLHLDADVSLSEFSIDRMEELALLHPFGSGNAALQFASRGVQLRGQPHRMGREQQHAKFWVTDGRTHFEVLWWNCGNAPSRKARLTWPLRLRSTTTTVDDPCNSNCWTEAFRLMSGPGLACSRRSLLPAVFHAMQPITYFNRYTGCLEQEAVYGEGFLVVGLWSGGGQTTVELLVKHLFSRFYGWWMSPRLGRIKPFVETFQLDVSEFAQAPEEYGSFNDFFFRRLKPDARPSIPIRLRLFFLPMADTWGFRGFIECEPGLCQRAGF